MKRNILFSLTLIVLLTILTTNVNAAPRWGCHRGWCGPRPIVRVFVPRVRVYAPPVVVAYDGPVCNGPRYYRHCPPPPCRRYGRARYY